MSITLPIVLHLLLKVKTEVICHNAQNVSPVAKQLVVAAQIKIEKSLIFARFAKVPDFVCITGSQTVQIYATKRGCRRWGMIFVSFRHSDAAFVGLDHGWKQRWNGLSRMWVGACRRKVSALF